MAASSQTSTGYGPSNPPAILLQGTSNWEDFAFKLKAVATTQNLEQLLLCPEQFKTQLQEARAAMEKAAHGVPKGVLTRTLNELRYLEK